MTRAEIAAFIPGTFGAPINLGAASYAVPTLAWLQGPCYTAFRARYWSENLDKWVVRWECRDFARAFACFAGECWATTVGGTEDDGLAVGEFWFVPEPAAARPARYRQSSSPPISTRTPLHENSRTHYRPGRIAPIACRLCVGTDCSSNAAHSAAA